MLTHGAVVGFTYLGLSHIPRIADEPQDQVVTLRLLEVHRPEPQLRRAEPGAAVYPAAASAQGALPAVPKLLPSLIHAHQTLLQPDLPPNVTLTQELPIPAALLWSAPNIRVTRLSPPERLDTSSSASPSLHLPNHEPDLSNVNISATPFASDLPALPPGKTSPVVTPGPEVSKKAPEMWSHSAAPAAPATVISVSDVQMQEGTIALPPVNEVATVSVADKLSPMGESVLGASGQAAGKAPGEAERGAGENKQGSDARALGNKEAFLAKSGPPALATLAATPSDRGSGSRPETAASGTAADAATEESSVTRIQLPKDGKFGVVVVGSSMAEQYPETLGLWEGRLAYTVYVHAGLPKNWILQYSLPRSADAAAGGEPIRPDAPWPFSIVVPRAAVRAINADTLMIHGFVNVAGRFEQLAVVSPQGFQQQTVMLSALREWQFRPASQNGRATEVEVLLIIPETAE